MDQRQCEKDSQGSGFHDSGVSISERFPIRMWFTSFPCLKADFRPTVGAPPQRPDSQGWSAVARAVVKMAAQPLRAAIGENARVARANEWFSRIEQKAPAAGVQIHSVLVQVWPGVRFAPADANVVSAPDTAA